jgi:hypothetical protein
MKTCSEHQVGMYVLAGVGDVATVLPVVEPRVQSHYFLDQPCVRDTVGTYQLISPVQDEDCRHARSEADITVPVKIEVLYVTRCRLVSGYRR